MLERSSLCGFVSGRGGAELSAPDVSLTVRPTPISKPATELAGDPGGRRSAAAAAVPPLVALPPPLLRKLPMRGMPWSEEVSSSPWTLPAALPPPKLPRRSAGDSTSAFPPPPPGASYPSPPPLPPTAETGGGCRGLSPGDALEARRTEVMRVNEAVRSADSPPSPRGGRADGAAAVAGGVPKLVA